jgi:hypothetical protein
MHREAARCQREALRTGPEATTPYPEASATPPDHWREGREAMNIRPERIRNRPEARHMARYSAARLGACLTHGHFLS